MTEPTPPSRPDDTNPMPPGPTGAGDDEAARLLQAGLSDPGTSGRPEGQGFPSAESIAARFDDLEILEVLGHGGMGVVYKARQRKLDRLVALKVLPDALAADPAFAERFAREARTLARLQHAHIVGVHDFGERDGLYYLLMEYVDGVTLRQLMSTGELTASEALTIVPQICDALQFAHDSGIVHRDIKPENVLLDRTGRVKVADFGLAKLIRRDAEDFTLTGTDQVMGSVHYMAPEQYRTPQDVDHRADIFSLGVVFFEMLTGELPVGRFSKPSESPDLDDRIDDIVLRALERERDLRYQQAADVTTDIKTLVAGAPAVPTRPTPLEEPAPAALAETPRCSRLAATALCMAPVGALISLLVAMCVFNALDSDPYPTHYGFMSGLWSGFGFAALTVALAIMGLVATRMRAAGRLQGRWMAILALVVGCIGLTATLAALGAESRSHKRLVAYDARVAQEPRRPFGFVTVRGVPSAHDQQEIRVGITETWTRFVRLASVRDLEIADMLAERLYDPSTLTQLRSLDKAAFVAKRDANELGIGFVKRVALDAAPSAYVVARIQVDASGRDATVTVQSHNPVAVSGQNAYSLVTFFMKRVGRDWFFVADSVKLR